MTFEIKTKKVCVTKDGWTAFVNLGEQYQVKAKYINGDLKFISEKPSIENEPVSWDTILEQVSEMIEEVEIPHVETNEFGGLQ